jgi:hypothetical protein
MDNTRIALEDIQPTLRLDDSHGEEDMAMEFSKKFADAFAKIFFDE